MTHIALASTKGSGTFSPMSSSYNRTTKSGVVPVFNFLTGSQFNTKIAGEIAITDVGTITTSSVAAVSGKLEIQLDPTSGTAEKIGTFTSFTFMYPGTRFIGHSELNDATMLANEIQRIRYQWDDLSTGDNIILDLESGVVNAQLVLRQTVDGVEKDLVIQQLTVGVTEVIWEIDYNEDGTSKLWFKEPATLRTRIFNGQITSDIGEAKLSVRQMNNTTIDKTVKTDFLFIFYKNVNINYDVPIITDITKGRIRMFDTNNQVIESLWTEIFASDHTFVGDRVMENGLIRCWVKSTPKMDIYGWNTTSLAWEMIGSNVPRATNGDLATTLHDVIFETFTDSQIKFTVKYGIVDQICDIKRGMPYVRFVQNSKLCRINTAKRRFALSTGTPASQITDFNHEKSDDTNKGNPLNLSPTNNPFIFTNDSTAATGLLLMDDNWFAWYDETSSSDMVGFLGNISRPIGLQISAVSATELEFVDITWDIKGIYCIGILEGDPTIKISNIPLPFNIGNPDTYVKWRATEGLMGFKQRPFLRKKR